MKASKTLKNQPALKERIFRKKNILLLSGILLLALAVYAQTLNNGFTNWDDRDNITANADIREFSLNNLKKIFTTDYVAMYVPLTMLTYAVNYSLSGNEPFSYHLLNLILHLLNIALVFVLLFKLTENSSLSLFIALFFAIHPMNVESVAWLSARSTLLYSFFFLLSLLFYLKYTGGGLRLKYLLCSLALFLLALLSKSAALTLPLLLLVLDYYRARPFNARLWLEKIPFFMLSAAAGISTYLLRSSSDSLSTGVYTGFQKILLSAYSILFYPLKLLVPFSLSPYHQMPQVINGFLPTTYYAAFALLLLLIAIAAVFRRKFFVNPDETRTLVTGALLFLLPNILVLVKIVPVGDQITAERYAYLPSIGFFLLLLTLAFKLKPRLKLWKAAQIFLLIAAAAYSALSYQYTFAYKDSMSLWSKAVESDESCALAWFVRATLKEAQGDSYGALADYDRAIYHRSDYENAYINRGVLRKKLKDNAGAAADFSRALQLNPGSEISYYNRGNLRLLLNDLNGAEEDYRAALKINPGKVKARLSLAEVLIRKQEPAQALEQYEQALSASPHEAGAVYYRRAKLRLQLKDRDSACADLSRIKTALPDDAALLFSQNCR